MNVGGWITVSNVVSPIIVQADRIAVATLFPIAASGWYGSAAEVATKQWLFTAALQPVLFSALSAAIKPAPARAAELMERASRVTLFALLPAAILLVAFAEPGLRAWIGPAYSPDAGPVLRWLAIAVYVNAVAQVPYSVLQGGIDARAPALLHLVELPLYLALLFWLAATLGVQGVAIAWFVRMSIDGVALWWMLYRRFDASRPIVWRIGRLGGSVSRRARLRRGVGREDLVKSDGVGNPIVRFTKRYVTAAAGALYAFTLGVGDARNRRLIQQLATQFGHRDGETPRLPVVPIDRVTSPTTQVALPEPVAADGNVTLLELLVLSRLVRERQPRSLFEIGTFDGRTTLALAMNADYRRHRLHTRPPATRVHGSRHRARRTSVCRQAAVWRAFSSHRRRDKIRQLYGDSATFDFTRYAADFVFVDGSHAYEYVLSDSERALALLQGRAGTIVWHDYGEWTGVTRAPSTSSRQQTLGSRISARSRGPPWQFSPCHPERSEGSGHGDATASLQG